MREGKWVMVYLVRRENGEGLTVFSLSSQKFNPPKWRENGEEEGGLMEITHLPLVLPHISVMLIFFFLQVIRELLLMSKK